MSYDELELDLVGDRKTALFVIISDTDDTFNFIVSIMYTQLFNLLCDRADDENPSPPAAPVPACFAFAFGNFSFASAA